MRDAYIRASDNCVSGARRTPGGARAKVAEGN